MKLEDIKTTADYIVEELQYLKEDLRDPLNGVKYAVLTAAHTIYYDIKFLFETQRARARVHNTGIDDDPVGPHQPFIDAIRTHLGWEDNA